MGLILAGTTGQASAQMGRDCCRGWQVSAAQPSVPPCVAVLFDANGDDILTVDEIDSASAQLLKLDANQDGEVTVEEFCLRCGRGTQCPMGRGPKPGRGMGARAAGQTPRFFALFDADHDGVLSASEIANAPAALRGLDLNADGTLTPEELRPCFQLNSGPRCRAQVMR